MPSEDAYAIAAATLAAAIIRKMTGPLEITGTKATPDEVLAANARGAAKVFRACLEEIKPPPR